MCERNDERTKASFGVGKSMTKTKGSLRSQRSIIEIHSLNRTVLINERSMKDRGNIGVVKGHQMIVTIEIKSYQRRSDKSPKGGALRQFPCCR